MNMHRQSNKYNKQKHHRRSLRLKGYDYSQNGAYFVTICTYNKELLFEDNRIKNIVEDEWLNTPKRRRNIILDEYVIMPNHIHGIIIIENRVGAYCDTPLQSGFRSPSRTLGSIIRGFKASSTKKINIIRNSLGIPVWQRNYYEHVIRNETDLYDTRRYIRENPLKWDLDENNPNNFRSIET